MNPEMESVIIWLRSPEGEAWSHANINSSDDGGPGRHSSGAFASMKYDHEGCTYDERIQAFRECRPMTNHFSWTDAAIKDEMVKYGMNGIPSHD